MCGNACSAASGRTGRTGRRLEWICRRLRLFDSSREPDVQEEEESAAHPTGGSGASSVGLDRKSQEPLPSRKQPPRPCSRPPLPHLCSLEEEAMGYSPRTGKKLVFGTDPAVTHCRVVTEGSRRWGGPCTPVGCKRRLVPRRDGPVGPGKRDSGVLGAIGQ